MRARHPGSALNVPDVRSVPVYIYALCEPDTGAIRYIGKSGDPRGRMSSHRSSSGARPVRLWLLGLDAAGTKPGLRILQTVQPGADAAEAERELIAQHAGPPLLNSVGHTNRKWTAFDAGARQLRQLIGDERAPVDRRFGYHPPRRVA